MKRTAQFLPFVILLLGLSVSTVGLAAEPDSAETDGDETRGEAELLDAASEIEQQVAEIRGLAPRASIPKGVKDRDQLREMLVERFHEEMSEDDFEAEARVYRRLGLLGDLDGEGAYRELMLDLLTEQIAGFYDQDTGELYIMKGLPRVLQRSTMAHEIFHAIQDQHFDINWLLEPYSSQEHADYTLARMALIEGDATVLMFDYELYDQGELPQGNIRSFIDVAPMAAAVLELDPMELAAADQLERPDTVDLEDESVPSLMDSELGSAPPIIRDPLLFPYTEGMRFVVRARSGRSWQEFDAIYENPPVSTSQILHPELFFDDVDPISVHFDASEPVDGRDLSYETVFGELKIRSWLTTHLDDHLEVSAIEDLAAGWRGDRLRGYEDDDGHTIVTHLSTWETVDDARDFAEALDEIARRRHDTRSSHTVGDHGEAWCLRVGDERRGERVVVERWGELVLYIEGTPSKLDDSRREIDATTYLMRDAIWTTHQRIPFDEELRRRRSDDELPGDAPESSHSRDADEVAHRILDCSS